MCVTHPRIQLPQLARCGAKHLACPHSATGPISQEVQMDRLPSWYQKPQEDCNGAGMLE